MNNILLTGFGDEAAVSLTEQMDVLEKNGINAIEMRNVNGKHVLDCTQEELLEIKKQLDERNFKISAIGSPVGESNITDNFTIEKEKFARAVNAAKVLSCKHIRAFSFFTPEGENPYDYSQEVLFRLKEMVSIAQKNGLVYALENESGIFSNNLERCEYLFREIQSDSLRLVLDPGNFIKNDTIPYPNAYRSLENRLAYFHIKDAKKGEEHFVPAGEGDGKIGEMLQEVYSKTTYCNYLSLEPHLGYMSELNMAQQFTTAVNALKKILNAYCGCNYELVDINDFLILQSRGS